MKKLLIVPFLLIMIQTTSSANSTRVESFHQQKRYIQGPKRINPYIRPYKSPSYSILSQHRSTHIRPNHRRVDYRYNPRYRTPYHDRYVPQRYYQTSCASVPRPIVAHPMSHPRYQIGQRVDMLPYGAMKILRNNRPYYLYENTYFSPRQRLGTRFYIVVDF